MTPTCGLGGVLKAVTRNAQSPGVPCWASMGVASSLLPTPAGPVYTAVQQQQQQQHRMSWSVAAATKSAGAGSAMAAAPLQQQHLAAALTDVCQAVAQLEHVLDAATAVHCKGQSAE